MFNVPEGNGCNLCVPGHPITFIYIRRVKVALCLECTKAATGWSTQQFEEHHAPLRDHLADAMARARGKQLAMQEAA